MPKIIVTMDPSANGDQEISNILGVIHGQGKAATAANVVRDAEGKVVRVEVNHPDNASDVAVAAVAASSGKAWASVVIPNPLFIFDLTGITATGATFTGSQRVMAKASQDIGGWPSKFLGMLDSGGFTDFDPNDIGAPFTTLQISQYGPLGDLVIGADALSLAFDGGSLDLDHSAITVQECTMNSEKIFYVSAEGKLYMGFANTPDLQVQWRTFDEAVAAGAI